MGDEARLPPLAPRSDWACVGAYEPQLAPLSAHERQALAAHWSRLGQMEHASIAAFARFGLQLLSLGAPADLLEDCARALADETAHAKLCFGIASAYAGKPLGPGPLRLDGCLQEENLAAIAQLVIAEGCLGETVAALEASEASEAATDPAIRALLARIAADERRHAALAFRFVSWAVAQGGDALRAELAASTRRLLAEYAPRHVEASVPLEVHGVLSASRLRALHRSVIREVVEPCLSALFVRGAPADQAGSPFRVAP